MISVIVSVYNVEKYIVNSLKSIVNQDYADFELVLIDDGSTDNSVDKINEYLSNSTINWRLVKKENGGQSSARNLGIKEAKGEYITFIDSDDVISKDFLSKLKTLIDENNADFSFCNFEYVKEQLPPTDANNKTIIFNRKDLLETFLKRTIDFVLPSMMFKTSFIKDNNLTLNENINFSEDQMFIWDVILKSNKSIYTYKKMYGYYIREKSIMTGSPYKKIMNGFEEYKSFTDRVIKEYPEYKEITEMILPRWQLGTLFSAAKIMEYDEFIDMYKQMSGNTISSRLRNIHEKEAIALGLVAKSPKLLYKLCRVLER